jgi:hypothetical protein
MSKRIKKTKPTVDVTIQCEGSVTIVYPQTKAAKDWVAENVAVEGWQMWCGGFAVDHCFVDDLIMGMEDAGLVVR